MNLQHIQLNRKVLSIVFTIPAVGLDEDALLESLNSIAQQQIREDQDQTSAVNFFKLIIFDTRCIPGTEGLVRTIFPSTKSDCPSCGNTFGTLIPNVHYFPLCSSQNDIENKGETAKFNKFTFMATLQKKKVLKKIDWSFF